MSTSRRHLVRSVTAVSAIVAATWTVATPALASGVPAGPPPTVETIEGIDVSHWQGTIDWSQVAAAGYRFAILKATEGQTFDDPNYASYRPGARAQKIYTGAYHFARPDATANDATIEADHYTSVAGLRSGDLIPVLDIEDSGGLSTNDLIDWVQAWLDRVSSTVGAKPMIYTGPTFWRTHMGDTSTFADEGYRLLWVANWNVPHPDVPGGNWGGTGWTFWQWTNCGSVPGISGCVDLDHLKESRKGRVRIP